MMLTILQDDFDEIAHLFERFLLAKRFHFYQRKASTQMRKGKVSKHRAMAVTTLTNHSECRFFTDNDYADKSWVAPSKVLRIIPTILRHYFWRGLVDADGCFTRGHFDWSSDKKQDWSEHLKMLNSIGVKKAHVSLKRYREYESSQLLISNKREMKLFGDYIYQGFDVDGIGLKRKWNRYHEIDLRASRLTCPQMGVCYHKKRGVWQAYISKDRVNHHLGFFPTMREAVDKRLLAERTIFS